MELLTGRIYIIRSPNTEMVYVGSTFKSLNRRFYGHISDWRLKSDKCTSSKLILEKGDAYIELLEEVLVENERELERLEQIWIDNTANAVNKNKSYRTIEEKVEYMRQHHKKYYETHKEELHKYQKTWREEHKEETRRQYKKYYETHKKEVLERQKIRHDKNKEERNKRIY